MDSAEKAFDFVYSKPYLKTSKRGNQDQQQDEQSSEQSETIDINSIQSCVNELVQYVYEEESRSKSDADLVLQYLFKATFDDFDHASDCSLNNIIIIGILIKLNYFNDILIMEFFQYLLKAKQLSKIKILLHLLGDSVNDENVISADIKNSLLEILNRRKIQLPLYPESFEWDMIFELCNSLEKRISSFNMTKDDILGLKTFALETESSNKVEAEIKQKNSEINISKPQQKTTDYSRTIYLIIKSSGTSDEIVHKVLNLNAKSRDEKLSILQTIIRNCSEDKLYSKLYENVILKLCDIKSEWESCLEDCFSAFYLQDIEDEELYPNVSNIQHLSTLFAKLLSEDCLDFKILQIVKINPRDSTERKRIFLKFLFKELVMDLSLENVKKIMLKNKKLKPYLKNSVFPGIENTKDLIYSINFFTAIDLGELTVAMRKELRENEDAIKKSNEDNKRKYEDNKRDYEDSNRHSKDSNRYSEDSSRYSEHNKRRSEDAYQEANVGEKKQKV